MREKIHNRKLFETAVIVVFVIFTVLFLLFSWLLLEKNNNSFADRYNDYFGKVSLNYNERISKELKLKFEDILTRMDHFVDHTESVPDGNTNCSSLYEDDKNFVGWYLYNSKREIVCINLSFENTKNNFTQYDDTFFSKSRKSVWFSPSFLLNDSDNVIKIYKNFFSIEGKENYSLVVVLNMDNFAKDYFIDDSLWYGSYFNVVSGDGQIVWSSDNSLLNKNIESDYIRQVFYNFSDALNLLQKARLGKNGFETFEYLAQNQVASYIKVPVAGDYYWSVVLYTPAKFVHSEILLDYTRSSYIFFYFVAFLLLIFLVVLYFLINRNFLLQLEVDDTKKEMIEETKKFKLSEIKLHKTVDELEQLNSTMVDRELKMIELKNNLKNKKKKK